MRYAGAYLHEVCGRIEFTVGMIRHGLCKAKGGRAFMDMRSMCGFEGHGEEVLGPYGVRFEGIRTD